MTDNGVLNTSEYNEEPVYYCENCLSLKIIDSDGICFCDKCGSLDIACDSIFLWMKKYELEYDKKFFDVEKIRRLKKLW